MSEPTQTLAEFLLARLREDEEAARDCAKVYPPPWDVSDRGHSATVRADEPDFHIVTDLDQDQTSAVEWLGDALWHIANHDPARVIAECEAKRRIVELHSQEYPHRMYGCKTCREWEEPDWPCSTLRLLAQPYADHHPDFREEWRA